MILVVGLTWKCERKMEKREKLIRDYRLQKCTTTFEMPTLFVFLECNAKLGFVFICLPTRL